MSASIAFNKRHLMYINFTISFIKQGAKSETVMDGNEFHRKRSRPTFYFGISWVDIGIIDIYNVNLFISIKVRFMTISLTRYRCTRLK